MAYRSALTIPSPSLPRNTADLTEVMAAAAAAGAEDAVVLEDIAEGGGTPGGAAPPAVAGEGGDTAERASLRGLGEAGFQVTGIFKALRN